MARRTPWVAICALCLTRTVSAACEPWCTEPCTVLNGDVTRECDECDTGDGFLCHPGAVGYDNWRDRRTQQVAVSALGQSKDKADDPYVIERTHKSVVYKEWYHKIAEQHRDEVAPVNISDPTFDGWVYNQTDLDPRESPRTCGVHSCVLIDGDEPCAKAAGSADCDKPRGHLRPFGEQWESLERVETVYASEYAAQAFWEGAMSKYKPVLIKGGVRRQPPATAARQPPAATARQAPARCVTLVARGYGAGRGDLASVRVDKRGAAQKVRQARRLALVDHARKEQPHLSQRPPPAAVRLGLLPLPERVQQAGEPEPAVLHHVTQRARPAAARLLPAAACPRVRRPAGPNPRRSDVDE